MFICLFEQTSLYCILTAMKASVCILACINYTINSARLMATFSLLKTREVLRKHIKYLIIHCNPIYCDAGRVFLFSSIVYIKISKFICLSYIYLGFISDLFITKIHLLII